MATSCLLDAVNSILTQLGAIPFDWGAVEGAEKSRPAKMAQLVRVWNNQVAREATSKEEGAQGYVFEKPACFLEVVPEQNMQFLDNVTYNDICWKLHIVDMELDAGDDVNMDQNLNVFKFRDLVKQYMTGFAPTNCTTMFQTDERQDYDHTGVYHYIVEMKSGFTDTKGSILDPDQVRVIYKEPPTNLELNTGFSSGDEPPVDPHTSYIWKVCQVRVNIVTVPDPEVTQLLDNGVTIPLQYVLNEDGTLTVPYLTTTPGIAVLTPFVIDNQPADTVTYNEGVFDNAAGGGFGLGNDITFNASLPLL